MNDKLTLLLAGAIGAVGMSACLGTSVVHPTQFEWLMHGDYALHFLGWHLYRHGPWTWPILGETPLLIWPVGSSIGLTDSIPVIAILLKPFEALLPQVFQFIGLWLVLSVALQGVFGVLLMRLATPRRSLQLLGAVILMLSPPLLYRINHAALTAHWLLLACLWLMLRKDAEVPSRHLAVWWAVVCAVTAATQPYLWLMVVVLMGAAHARQALVFPRRVPRIALHVAAALAASWVALWQSGSLMVRAEDGLEVAGFGVWSANLLTFIMPTEGPTLFSPGPFPYEHREQYEGYAYLGAGVLGLALIAVAVAVSRLRTARLSPGWWQHVPLVLALGFLLAMALGPHITAGAHTVFTYDRTWWGPFQIFRTSGRMIWPLYYAVVIAILYGVTRLPFRRALVTLLLALVVQAVDIAGFAGYLGDVRAFGFRDPLQNAFWRVVPPNYDALILIPSNLCAPEGYLDFTPFALHAGNSAIGINAGITARFDVSRARQYCRELRNEIRTGLGSERALYVVRFDLVPQMMAQSAGRIRCTAVDGFGLCFTPGSVARWGARFDVARSRLPDASEFMRFYRWLDETYRDVLGRTPHPTTALEPRVEALVRYLGYRMEGCDHRTAEQRALAPDAEPHGGLCPEVSLDHSLPPADQTLAFYHAAVAELQHGSEPVASTHVDAEGEVVWLQTYARERARGAREPDARATVLKAIRGQ